MTARDGLPPGLSTLWEPVDAADALAARFGFADLAAASTWAIDALATGWELAATAITRLVISDHNAVAWVGSDRGDLVVKWSHDAGRFAALEASTAILRRVGELGVPVAAPRPDREGRDRILVDGPSGPLSTAVLPEVAGEWLDVADPAAVRAAGACLAEVHAALATIDGEGVTRMGALGDRMRLWLAHGDRGHDPEASRRLATLVADAPALTGEPQLVHNDFRAANVLVDGATVVAVLDFDDVWVDQPVSDLAKASTYLGTLFTGWGPTPREVQHQLVAGYESVRPLTPAEAEWYEVCLLWQTLIAGW